MNRITIAVAVAATALALGCVKEESHNPVGHALPTADTMRVNLPQENAQQYVLGQTADFYMFTRQVTRTFNAGAAWVLVVVHTVVQYPPTTIDGNVYTWGPHSRPLQPAEWRLIVTDNADGSYDWSLDGRSKTETGADWMTVISGNAVPGAIPHHGSGNFMVDFDAAEAVNPIDNDAHGTVDVSYDLENTDGTQATLSMHIETTQLDESGVEQPVVADYFYGENLDGSGDFQFSINADINDNGSLFEDALVRSRWLMTGEGRSDVLIQGGDLGEDTSVTGSECWDIQFRRTYYQDSIDWQPTEGDPADCVFADQDLPDA